MRLKVFNSDSSNFFFNRNVQVTIEENPQLKKLTVFKITNIDI